MTRKNEMTDFDSVGSSSSDWLDYFEFMRANAKQTIDKKMHCYDRNTWFASYDGDTQYKTYCKFINGILSSIRSGGKDYCYFIYQIAELLRFEKNGLMAKWLPEDKCFEVWLKR